MSEDYLSRKLMEFEWENRKYYSKEDYDNALRAYVDMLIFGQNGTQKSTTMPLPMLVNIADENGRFMPYVHQRNMPFRFIKGHGQVISGDYSYLHQRNLLKAKGEVMGLDLEKELSYKGNMFH